ncbi:hypothetical protein RZN05_00615 [Sphingomonas sp. HF-S4]|uniref:Uncharacterized protein n=1 Tax=Sphingomonas agrestis TaxID=3080540 RepID=A0ABU3Y2L6_9SPHN|nr:hypothetical protein [Sphingomonas sp. HF-S4]MDV3455468.1 hypothetical protein [Sphingomonas sp. HF-S4]
MYVQPGEWSNFGTPRASEARSIGTILSEMRELAVLRACPPRRTRSGAARG